MGFGSGGESAFSHRGGFPPLGRILTFSRREATVVQKNPQICSESGLPDVVNRLQRLEEGLKALQEIPQIPWVPLELEDDPINAKPF